MDEVTPTFRVSYPKLFKPELNNLNGKMEYSVVALFKKGEDISKLKAVVKAAIEKKWGADPSRWPKKVGADGKAVNAIRSPFRDQAERKKAKDDGTIFLPPGYEDGAVFINLRTTQRPVIVDQKKNDIIDETQVYAGCWCKAYVSAFAYDQKGNQGVSLSLGGIQKVKDDEPISGRPRAEDMFSPIEGAGDMAVGAGGSATDLF
jgi:hypothetical protein